MTLKYVDNRDGKEEALKRLRRATDKSEHKAEHKQSKQCYIGV